MKYLLLPSLFLFVLFSCGDATSESTVSIKVEPSVTGKENIQKPQTSTDTLPDMPEAISGRVNQTLNFPYLLNQDGIDKLDLSDNELSTEEVELLSQYLIVKDGISNIGNLLNSYFSFNHLIDSIGEEAYNDQIDLGMTQYFDAYLHYRVNLGEHKYYLIWSLDYGTYEACPYYEGQYVLATLCVNDKISNTVYIGEDSGGGDPPYMTSVFAGGDLWDTYIEVKRFEEYTEDIDMPSSDEYEMQTITEKSKSKCRYLITDQRIILDK